MIKRRLLLFTAILLCLMACKIVPEPYSLNESVKQEVENKSIDSVTVIPGEIYEAGKFKRFFLGDHYRDTWTTPIKVPILNLDKAKGGLEILDRGGGQQTYSLKLKGENGRLYSLRSVQKDPSPTLPKPLQYSFADDIVQDQISASHPFGAFILSPLGDAAGIYHTNPRLLYIPDTKKLGKYREEFGGVLAMIEQDADENWSNYEDFGYTENAVSSETVREDLADNNENRVDEDNLLRVRLFDIWVGDWDRHDGQYRWAELEDDRGKYFRPIPEDRDNVFFKFDGFFPWWARRKWALRKFQSFDEGIRDIAGLNHNARYLDRRFLTESSRDKWISVAEDLQKRLTDEIIEKAITNTLPDKVFENDGEFLISNLKARRNKLTEFAERYYKILAEGVDIVLSNANEYVEVEYDDRSVTVKVSDATDEGDKNDQFYHRKFLKEETDEVRIYTRGDEDFIYLRGQADKAPLVRIIAGEGVDYIYDSSKVSGLSKNNYIYDNIQSTTLVKSGDTKSLLSESLDVNEYDFKSFKYDYLGPAVFVGYNNDDGIYLGGGIVIKKYGFRKEPYAYYQKTVVNVAPNTFAWNFDTEHDFKNVIGDMGFNFTASVRAPNFFTNFYGLGNETTIDPNFDEDDDFYRVKFNEVTVNPGLTIGLNNNSTIKLGPEYQYISVERSDNILTSTLATVGDDVYDDNHFIGAKIEADIRTIESTIYPENGIRWQTSINWQSQVQGVERKVSNLKSQLRGYFSIEEPTLITFASRVGFASLSGNYAFYQANTVGGNAGLGRLGNLRGFNRDRFSGRTSVYNNNEIRIRLARIPFYYLPLAIGISGHFDTGRVWITNEDSSKWHNGFGGGLWFNPLGKWVFTTTYTHSEEDDLIMLNLGFLF